MQQVDPKMADRGAWVSLITYFGLAICKLTIGYGTGSKALLADGLNNSTDMISSVAILIGLKLSRKPPDHNHPYGHKRAETVASMFVSFIMLVIGIEVVYQSLKTVMQGATAAPNPSAAYLAVGCAAIMYFVYRYNRSLARKTKSQGLMAAAKDNLADVWVSLGAAIAIFGAQMELWWMDPLAAIIVGLLILKTAWEIFMEATQMLTDGIDKTQLHQLTEIMQQVQGVNQVRDVKARLHGHSLLVDVTIWVDADLTVKESHLITEMIEKQVKQAFAVTHIHIHCWST